MIHVERKTPDGWDRIAIYPDDQQHIADLYRAYCEANNPNREYRTRTV